MCEDQSGQSDKGQCGEETKHQALLRVWACKEANKPWRSSLLWHEVLRETIP